MGLVQDRVVVVTGASRGAGRGIALELGRTGATVYYVEMLPETIADPVMALIVPLLVPAFAIMIRLTGRQLRGISRKVRAAEVELVADGYVDDASGVPYSGNVNVQISHCFIQRKNRITVCIILRAQ